MESSNSRDPYPSNLKAFALTLHFYSPKAYEYVRETFNCNLPHVSTLRRWYKCVNGAPGFTQEALTALKDKAEEAGKMNKTIHCGLIVDEMSIRHHIEWDTDHFSGYIDLGTELNDDQLPYAKDALVFMLNALNGNWKIPVAYFLINGLSGVERANLIKEALCRIHKTGINVISLTFDGTATNIATAHALGANLHPDNIKHFFLHPVTNKEIYIIMDPCHMIKLIRNCLASKGSICDEQGELIKWQYIVDLNEIQEKEGLHLATKIRKQHMQWQREKMKVKLATQVLSRSVADALTYLNKDLKKPQFTKSEATVTFLRLFNDLFDILNSRNLLNKEFKAPIQSKNKDLIMNFFDKCKLYIKNLRTANDGEYMLYSNRKTGFLGFLVCMESVRSIFYSICENNPHPLSFFLTYKLSQDHLELFFSAIRSKGGYNNNPSAKQFAAAYKRLLIHHHIMTSDSANCLIIDTTNIINVSNSTNVYLNSINISHNDENSDSLNLSKTISEDHCYATGTYKQLSEYVKDVAGHIAGFIFKKLEQGLKCEACISFLSDCSFVSMLSSRKNRGGLKKPSNDMVTLCKVAEQTFRVAQATGKLTHKNIMHFLIAKSLTEIHENYRNVFIMSEHSLDHGPLDNHRVFLIKSILFEYFKIRLYHAGKIISSNLQSSKIRSINLKTIHFKGQ